MYLIHLQVQRAHPAATKNVAPAPQPALTDNN